MRPIPYLARETTHTYPNTLPLAPRGYVIYRTCASKFTEERNDPRRDSYQAFSSFLHTRPAVTNNQSRFSTPTKERSDPRRCAHGASPISSSRRIAILEKCEKIEKSSSKNVRKTEKHPLFL